jgi:hypothetical protein
VLEPRRSGLTDNACHVIIHILDPRSLRKMASYDVASIIREALLDGYSLIACSTDGTLAVFTFDAEELGVKLTDEAAQAFLAETYGGAESMMLPASSHHTLLPRLLS